MEIPEVASDQSLEYYSHYIDRCWTASQHYKEDLNKLMLWIGSIFVAIVIVTGIFGATSPLGMVFTLTFVHVIIFHVIFAICWFFYLHKKLRAEMFLKLGIEAEKYMTSKLIINHENEIPSFFDMNSYYPSTPGNKGISLSNIALVLVLILYLCLVTWPIISGSFTGKGITLNYEPILGLSIFALIIFCGQKIYLIEAKRIMKEIENKWGNLSVETS